MPVMGIEGQCDVRVRLPQMIQHGFQVGSLHLISFFSLCVRGAHGAMDQQKGGVFAVCVLGTFVLPLFPDGRGSNLRSGALPSWLFGSGLRE